MICQRLKFMFQSYGINFAQELEENEMRQAKIGEKLIEAINSSIFVFSIERNDEFLISMNNSHGE